MAENKKILATEARQIMKTSSLPLNRIYKMIRETAKEGYGQLTWTVEGFGATVIANLITALRDDGYSVIPEGPVNKIVELVIGW